jgi:flavodoxin
MTALVVYDSAYGNTKQIAQAIGGALDAETIHVSDVKPEHLEGLTLLVVGSPTQKFSPLGSITRFLKSIPTDGLKGVKVAAFDTRFPENEIEKVRILALFVRIFGYAAEPIADRLKKKGGELAASPGAFYVGETKGPLLDGELERAAEWARQIGATGQRSARGDS